MRRIAIDIAVVCLSVM